MKSNELRLRNIVSIKGKEVIVSSISESGINMEACGGYYAGEASLEYEGYFENWGGLYSNTVISPIPLTATWCEKFGGKYHDLNGDVGHYQFKSEIGIVQILHGEDGNFYYDYKLEIKYVHQLQNLFFALTGEELTIKEL